MRSQRPRANTAKTSKRKHHACDLTCNGDYEALAFSASAVFAGADDVAAAGSVIPAEAVGESMESRIKLGGGAGRLEFMLRYSISRSKVLLADWLSKSTASNISTSSILSPGNAIEKSGAGDLAIDYQSDRQVELIVA